MNLAEYTSTYAEDTTYWVFRGNVFDMVRNMSLEETEEFLEIEPTWPENWSDFQKCVLAASVHWLHFHKWVDLDKGRYPSSWWFCPPNYVMSPPYFPRGLTGKMRMEQIYATDQVFLGHMLHVSRRDFDRV